MWLVSFPHLVLCTGATTVREAVRAARWRSEKPHVVEEYKNRAEEEKRHHAIDHPGYPRKPSEKKKRMIKSKLAKLVAKSGSINATMDARRSLQISK
ncbi:hypothetical protein BST61_g8509 [Cercospora zeina]